MFSPSNELIVFVSRDCPLVNTASYFLNPNLVLNLYATITMQPVITFIANSSSKSILLTISFLFNTTISNLRFLYFKDYSFVISSNFL